MCVDSSLDSLKALTKLSEKDCREFVRSVRWEDGKPVCPHCGYDYKIYELKDGKFKCASCRRKFTVTTGTIFHDSKLPLTTWFHAVYVITSHKKGISSCQLAKDLGVTQKTAWFILHRIRFAMQSESWNLPLTGVIEIDETYVGGKEKNKHASKRTGGTTGRSLKGKVPVIGILQRETVDTETGEIIESQVMAQVVPDTKQSTLDPIITENVEKGSVVHTDEFSAYNGLEKAGYAHTAVSHGARVYVVDSSHTNTIEGFWSHLKRGIYGIYHHVSHKHLHRYVSEFELRYNTRKVKKEGLRVKTVLSRGCRRRLSWKELVAK